MLTGNCNLQPDMDGTTVASGADQAEIDSHGPPLDINWWGLVDKIRAGAGALQTSGG